MRKTADLLDMTNGAIQSIYVSRTKQSAADLKKWMDDETWMTAAEAVERGFADRVVENMKVAASVRDPSKFKHLPVALRPNRLKAAAALKQMSAVKR